MGLLQRLGRHGGGRELPELAVVGDVSGPQRLQHRHHLLHVGNTLVLVHAAHHAVELTLVGAAADAELDAPAGQQVEHADLAGQLDRMPVGRLNHGGAQADVVGVGAEPGEKLERGRADGHLDGVMLGGPDHLEAAAIGHLHHLQQMARGLFHVLVGTVTFQVDDKAELHGALRMPVIRNRRVGHGRAAVKVT